MTDVNMIRIVHNMGTRKVELGETGRTVAAQVKRIRERRGMSFHSLSEMLERLGRPILPSGLHRIEQGTRRVDVDDLIALAAALNVSPQELYRPPEAAPPGITQDEYDAMMDAAGQILRAAQANIVERPVTGQGTVWIHQPQLDE